MPPVFATVDGGPTIPNSCSEAPLHPFPNELPV